MRFLFTTLQFRDSAFCARVDAEPQRLGHETEHMTFAWRSARELGASLDAAALGGASPLVPVAPVPA